MDIESIQDCAEFLQLEVQVLVQVEERMIDAPNMEHPLAFAEPPKYSDAVDARKLIADLKLLDVKPIVVAFDGAVHYGRPPSLF
jgi:hypothetical protein